MITQTTSARRRLAVATATCALCAGLVAPQALADPSAPAMLSDMSSVTWQQGDAPGRDALLNKWLGESGIDTGTQAVVIVTPGTDDTGLHPRVDPLVGGRNAGYVQYPQSFFPITAGKSDAPLGLPFLAPSYRDSRTVAEDRNLAVMRALQDFAGPVVYTGYSQGSEALGNVAERASAEGLLGPDTLIVLVSDPRGPWGIKGWAEDLPLSEAWLSPLLGAMGVDNDGVRDPQDAGDAQIVAVIVQGDPVSDWQWQTLRPVSSLLVNLAGFLAIHAVGDGAYAHLDDGTDDKGRTVVRNAGNPTELHSGGTTYKVYDTYHPLALLNARVFDALGIDYDDADLARWDREAELFYPMTDVADKPTYGGVPVESGPLVRSVGADPDAGAAAPLIMTASSTGGSTAESRVAEAASETHQGRHRRDDPADARRGNHWGAGETHSGERGSNDSVSEDSGSEDAESGEARSGGLALEGAAGDAGSGAGDAGGVTLGAASGSTGSSSGGAAAPDRAAPGTSAGTSFSSGGADTVTAEPGGLRAG